MPEVPVVPDPVFDESVFAESLFAGSAFDESVFAGSVFTESVFTESVFGLPGLGKTAVAALDGFDLPTVQGIVVFSTIAIIALNLIVDLLYAWIDPRIRLT